MRRCLACSLPRLLSPDCSPPTALPRLLSLDCSSCCAAPLFTSIIHQDSILSYYAFSLTGSPQGDTAPEQGTLAWAAKSFFDATAATEKRTPMAVAAFLIPELKALFWSMEALMGGHTW